MSIKIAGFLALLLLANLAVAANHTKPHFQHWFYEMRPEFQYLLEHNCSREYRMYLDDQKLNDQNPLDHENCKSCAIAPVVKCIYDKAWGVGSLTMQAAQVVLGLLPTILTFTGASKVETGILSLRRPVLAFLLSAGAPAVNPLRTAEYCAPATILQQWPGRKQHNTPHRNCIKETLLVTSQYVVAFAAVANVVEVSYELAFWAVCSYSPETVYMPFLWPSLALALHALGAMAVALRVDLVKKDEGHGERKDYQGIRSWLGHRLSEESHLCASAVRPDSVIHKKPLILRLKDETYAFLFLNWLMSTGAILHMILGTVVLSSTLFISTGDALVVAFRYILSTVACRLVVTFELCGLREVTDVEMPMPSWSGGNGSPDQDIKAKKSMVTVHGVTI